MTSNKSTKQRSEIAKLLAPYDMTLFKNRKFTLGATNNIRSHINYLQTQIDEYQALITKIQALTPGDLFVWSYMIRVGLRSYKPSPVIIRFNFIDCTNYPFVTVLACEKKFLFHRARIRSIPTPKEGLDLNLEINDMKNWTPITVKDLPLYLHMEKRFPLFDEILKGTSQ